jgi:hypothetical protein
MDQQTLLREAEAYIQTQVRSGFYSRQQVLEQGRRQFMNDPAYRDCLTDDDLRQLIDQAIAQQLQEERSWPRHTDCDALDVAFAALERGGIAARHDYACCQTCGHNDIQAELAQGRDVRGYVFYHRQDTEKALAGYGLMLSYGAMSSDERAQLKIGQQIVFALRDAGLEVAWSGNPYERIYIRHFQWQRRFPLREAA